VKSLQINHHTNVRLIDATTSTGEPSRFTHRGRTQLPVETGPACAQDGQIETTAKKRSAKAVS